MIFYPELRLQVFQGEALKRRIAERKKQKAKNKNSKAAKAPKATRPPANGKTKSKAPKRKPGRKKGPAA